MSALWLTLVFAFVAAGLGIRAAGLAQQGRRLDGPPSLRRARRRSEQALLGGAGRNARHGQRCGRRRKFPDVLVFLAQGDSTGGTEGSIVNHVAFRVPTLSTVEAAGLKVARLANFPGVASTNTPEGERIELFENAALNLTFTQDAGYQDATAERHNRPLADSNRLPSHPSVPARGSSGRGQGVVRAGCSTACPASAPTTTRSICLAST